VKNRMMLILLILGLAFYIVNKVAPPDDPISQTTLHISGYVIT